MFDTCIRLIQFDPTMKQQQLAFAKKETFLTFHMNEKLKSYILPWSHWVSSSFQQNYNILFRYMTRRRIQISVCNVFPNPYINIVHIPIS